MSDTNEIGQFFVDASGVPVTASVVVDRLRRLDMKDINMNRGSGHCYGQCWAAGQATPAELRRLDSFRDESHGQHGPDEWADRIKTEQSGKIWDAAMILAGVIRDERLGSDQPAGATIKELEDFWQDVWDHHGERKNGIDFDFVCGFAEGAIDVWDRLKDRVNA